MKHKISKKTLGRKSPHRKALLKNMTANLLLHGSIITTRGRAKELTAHAERLIARAKGAPTLGQRRQLLDKLGSARELALLIDAASAAAKRSSGYLRLTRLPRRLGDGAEQVRVDLIKDEESA